MNESTPPPKPRRWKTFSLRTLMIFVLFIGASWTVTQLWGIASIKTRLNALTGTYALSYTCPAPGVVHARACSTNGQTYNEWYLWLPGWSHPLTENFDEPFFLVRLSYQHSGPRVLSLKERLCELDQRMEIARRILSGIQHETTAEKIESLDLCLDLLDRSHEIIKWLPGDSISYQSLDLELEFMRRSAFEELERTVTE